MTEPSEGDDGKTKGGPAKLPAQTDARREMIVQVLRAILELEPAPAPAATDRTSQLLCERCGTPKQLIAKLPATDDLPSVHVMQCSGCEIIDLIQASCR